MNTGGWHCGAVVRTESMKVLGSKPSLLLSKDMQVWSTCQSKLLINVSVKDFISVLATQ